jgi:8-hydroxy-5-deazaflavin:NADPH oxidoreductase
MAVHKIGVLGSGKVGEVLADGFLKHGYDVMRGSRDPAKLAAWKQAGGAHASVGTFAETAAFGEVVVLAVKGVAAAKVVEAAGPANLAGKTVLDTTNPIAETPPVNGVIGFFTDFDESLMEKLQKQAPAARFVKAFSCVGNALMVNPQLAGGPPTMFICGNDATAKAEANAILVQFGWEISDLGAMEAARAIEPLCMLWCIPGFLRNEWTHAYKVLKK